jgi:hypothetical protein
MRCGTNSGYGFCSASGSAITSAR